MSLIEVGLLIVTADQTLCHVATLSDEAGAAGDFRQKYILQAELNMGLQLTLGANDILAGQDAACSIDNTAACRRWSSQPLHRGLQRDDLDGSSWPLRQIPECGLSLCRQHKTAAMLSPETGRRTL